MFCLHGNIPVNNKLYMCLLVASVIEEKDLTKEDGHLKPFGYGRPSYPVDTIDHFPEPRHFFEQYVYPTKPLFMKGVVNEHTGYQRWTDEYLKFVSKQHDHVVAVEIGEGIKYSTKLQMWEFVDKYTNTEYMYLFTPVPHFLRYGKL